MKKNNENRMTLNDLLTMTFTEATHDHMRELRERLYNLGLIKTPDQMYLYTEEAKREALKWYGEKLREEMEKGSTGWRGKWFEVKTRIDWSIAHVTRYLINDVKCRPSGLADRSGSSCSRWSSSWCVSFFLFLFLWGFLTFIIIRHRTHFVNTKKYPGFLCMLSKEQNKNLHELVMTN